ncbi:hypothetical protein GCM10007920_45160 [Ciceribacter naphthalenivorans]|uniref:Uncharacterized protein n=2 Tax=Alphaproteobacteria TaxID=28211 RepID=A0A512HFF5_9HYPH|nr:hypothetical protein RNA01_11180 [Ciceribacter naphthalenivorans]GLR24722.1 hypothetical protein GCM10007920_45160 [Ciceribacter naphthalenivorans]GLT07578.1 hypothetical protein GCM10007926_45160 [Sphingomonas psychrolutea]
MPSRSVIGGQKPCTAAAELAAGVAAGLSAAEPSTPPGLPALQPARTINKDAAKIPRDTFTDTILQPSAMLA